MSFTTTKKIILGLTATFTLAICKPATAGTFHNGWYYTLDSPNDSVGENQVGGTIYEIGGMAYTTTDTEVIFAVKSNFPLDGNPSSDAQDGHVAWGDLFLNFSGQNLDTASNNALLHAIRFRPGGETGIYGNVIAKDVAYENGLLLSDRSLRGYNNYVISQGGNPNMGDLGAYDPYFNQNHHVQNVMASGNRIGDVNIISDFSGLGLDFGFIGATGTNIMGFSVARSSLPTGDFLAHLAEECDNDISAMYGNLEAIFTEPEKPTDVPEPQTVTGLLVTGLLGMLSKRMLGA
ncbi:MAG: PEP-CTERM sorting domain-containing protein [Okeania sp. SIO2D1]|nr:PEP-CTERM sorting domain-containing protein [Trichodesmium sp. MO_231.B1]NES64968.1 PEP-CTERM sorting domain-containing protein [Okeania sp. SIO2D1]